MDEDGNATHYVGIQDDVTELFMLKAEMENVKEEKQVLMTEVHHRVKNNLAVVGGMLELEMGREEKKKALEKSRIRIKSMAMIHEDLYSEEGLSKIKFNRFIRRFISQVDMIQDSRKLKLNYHLNLHPVVLTINQAIPLAVIFAELLNNVYEHAYPNQETGSVHISLFENSNIGITLQVKDFGIGVGEQFSNERSSNMGFIMARQLTNQLKGKLDIGTNPEDNATIAEIRFLKKDVSGSSQKHRIHSQSSI
ncbi:MAG: hypothetical protein FH748_11135 [Balneolaceae bacterium]|nr:hypothetical protein [Balneolaceae bacterium]